LHRRIALRTILLVGDRPVRVVGGFMAASGALSMWLSNTATVVMMLPIALSVIHLVRQQIERSHGEAPAVADFPFAICLLLGTAYAASIGGVATLIGTPPNLMLAAFLDEQYGTAISFAAWLPLGLAVTAAFLPIAWVVLTRWVFPIRLQRIPGGRALFREQLREHGPMTFGEGVVLAVFAGAALAWISRGWLADLELGDGWRPLAGLSDAGIAIGAALVLFAIPVRPREHVFVLSWSHASRLPWGILLLFGGGLSLADAVRRTGVDAFLGRGIATLGELPVPLVVVLVTTLVIFLTELTSNTATTATLLPILAGAAEGLHLDPRMLAVPATLAASCAFMLPVGTPPNAIVFGSGEVTIPQMCRAGIWLNLIGVAIIVAAVYSVGITTLGIP
jgi:sodium-dependent dicarboxylate transporter 2/3/5